MSCPLISLSSSLSSPAYSSMWNKYPCFHVFCPLHLLFFVLRPTVLTRIIRVTAGSDLSIWAPQWVHSWRQWLSRESLSIWIMIDHWWARSCVQVHCRNPSLLSSEVINSISSAVLESQHFTSRLTVLGVLKSLCLIFHGDRSALEVMVWMFCSDWALGCQFTLSSWSNHASPHGLQRGFSTLDWEEQLRGV